MGGGVRGGGKRGGRLECNGLHVCAFFALGFNMHACGHCVCEPGAPAPRHSPTGRCPPSSSSSQPQAQAPPAPPPPALFAASSSPGLLTPCPAISLARCGCDGRPTSRWRRGLTELEARPALEVRKFKPGRGVNLLCTHICQNSKNLDGLKMKL